MILSQKQSETKQDRDEKSPLLSLSSIVENNTRALQQGADIGQRGWNGDIDAIVS